MMTPSTRSWPSIPISTFFPFRPSSGLVRPSLATRSRPSPLAYLVRSLRNAVYIGRYSEVGKKHWEGPLASAVPLEQLDRVRALRQTGACPPSGERADPESLRLRWVRRVGPRRL